MDVVRQDARAWSRCSTGFAALSLPSRTGGSSASSTNGFGRDCSWPAPKNVSAVELFWPASTHWLRMRNLNFAIDGVALMASTVLERSSTATPLTVFASTSAVATLTLFIPFLLIYIMYALDFLGSPATPAFLAIP